jgi:hypothetical protein
MTTNNAVKALRPCTLPKEFNAPPFDVYAFEDVGWWKGYCKPENNEYIPSSLIVRIAPNDDSLSLTDYRFQIPFCYKDEQEYAQSKLLEVYLVIASAQRPWLKAEGFEFDTCVDYIVLCEPKDRPYIAQHHHTTDTGEHFFTVDGKYTIGAIVAFKPISDSQEAWDAVAHVEAWEG